MVVVVVFLSPVAEDAVGNSKDREEEEEEKEEVKAEDDRVAVSILWLKR